MRNLAHSSLRSGFVVAGLTAVCLLGVLEPAPAQTGHAGAGSSTATATDNRNVYAGGGQVRPSAPVNGDFTAAGGKVVVDQPVGGDASLAGGSVDVRAPVGDDVRAVGGDVSVESTIGGELFAAGANITLTRAAAVGRGASLYGSSVSIDGRIDGELRATAQKITIDGEVRGNARLVAEQIELGPKARIGGGLSYVSRSDLKKAEGATIGGAVTRHQDASSRRGAGGGWEWAGAVQGPSWVGGVMSFLALLAFAVIFLLIVPQFGEQASDRIKASPWLALAVGLGSVITVPVLAVLLFATLLGIPLAIAVLALYPALMLAGFSVGVLLISRLLITSLRKQAPSSLMGRLGYFAAGLLLTLLMWRVPFIGGVLVGLLTLAGVGACVLELYGRRNGPTSSVAAERPGRGAPAEAR